MALCCIGGVCVPYSAVVPFLLLGLKWMVTKLVQFGIVPASITSYLPASLSKSSTRRSKTTKSCCTDCGEVSHITDESQWNELSGLVVVKWTATWCGPCKAIQPAFEKLSASTPNATFVTMDVDALDETAARYKILALPTFMAVRDQKVVGSVYAGSDETKLTAWLETVLKKAH